MSLPDYQTGYLTEPGGARMPYVLIGSGPLAMTVVPGAADGIRTCVDVALFLAWFYRHRAERFRILILSRREEIPDQFGFERHADDMIRTASELGFGPSVWECLSAAGPIGQWIAVKRPDLVRGLILSSSYDIVSDRTRKVLQQWLQIAEHPASLEAFSEGLARKYQPPPEILSQDGRTAALATPSSANPERLQRILAELLQLDQRDVSRRITCPTLIIAGADDRVVPTSVQHEMAERISTSTLEICPGYGHFNDMENPAYHERVEQFAADVTESRP